MFAGDSDRKKLQFMSWKDELQSSRAIFIVLYKVFLDRGSFLVSEII